jgi:hypothetical protein
LDLAFWLHLRAGCGLGDLLVSDLARFLFDRQADSYDSDPAMRELAWMDPDIRDFWYAEEREIIGHLVREGLIR